MDFYEFEKDNETADTEGSVKQEPAHYEAPAAPAKKKKNHTWLKVTALALCCTILGAALGVGGSFAVNMAAERHQEELQEPEPEQEPEELQEDAAELYEGRRETNPLTVTAVDTSRLMTAAEVYAENVNSTVGITTSITTTNYWGYQTTGAAAGSGFVLTADGYILTNYHVIDSSNSVTVAMYDGTTYDAEIIGFDQRNDIAVLKVDAEGLVPVILGSSDTLNVGDDVIAIGNPLGELTFSLTRGIVSALNREVTMSNGATMDLIQTDCAINSGNSGGALFNMYGEVVGITNAKYSSSGSQASIDNIGFAIPINSVRGIIEGIIENGCIVKPYIGVSVTNVSDEALGYGLPEGASVQSITEDSPAAKAKLKINDIIVKADDTDITGSSDLVDFIRSCTPGQSITLTVYRQGEFIELDLTVGEQTQSALEEAAVQQPQQQAPQQQPQQQMPGGGFFGFPFGFFG